VSEGRVAIRPNQIRSLCAFMCTNSPDGSLVIRSPGVDDVTNNRMALSFFSSPPSTMSPMNHNIFHAIDSQVVNIEADIAHLHARIRTLKSQRNASTPLCRLPIEVLQDILHAVLDAKYAFLDDPSRIIRASPSTQNHDHTLHMFSLCRHVRTVALNTPYLWSYITTANASWIDTSLERNAHLLSVVWDAAKGGHLKLILEELIGRSREVYVTREVYSSCSSLFQAPLPYLKSLVHLPQHQSVQLHVGFLGGFTSSLTKLVLGRACLSGGIAFPALLELAIEGTDQDSTTHLPSLIRSSPLLRNLSLSGPALRTDRAPSAETPILLPSLRVLRVNAKPHAACYLLSFLPTPLEYLSISTQLDTDPGDSRVHHQHLLERMLPTGKALPPGLTTSIQPQADLYTGCDELCISYTHRAGLVQVFRAQSKTIDDLFCWLSSSTTLRLSVHAAHNFFVCASMRDAQYFPALQHIIIILPGVQHSTLQAWLQARVDLGNRLRILDILDGKVHSPLRDGAFNALQAVIVRGAFVETLCRNGVPVWTDDGRRPVEQE
jgi:hypothetical protein